MAAVEHDGRFVLSGGARGGAGEVRQKPEIFNTEQGSQFTSAAFTGALAEAGNAISMDGRGRWMDNVFIERLWRSLKYEDVYLKSYADGAKPRAASLSGSLSTMIDAPTRRWQTVCQWRFGARRSVGARAVDVMDNGSALPTCPQPQQQTQPLAAWVALPT